ncbi:hypothetical protein [Legionella nautarum]|uniref:hypothetical protein n=1 Tax=Legionella nautarum TaxID=45070 RepID=UPI001054C630|nr:hypothetical protein [Legionella nautarum]
MSDLKRMMRALAVTIIRYNEAQTEKDQSALARLKKPHEELLSDLRELIVEATKKYNTRTPVLNYLLHLIRKFKPLVDQATPLKDSDYQEIENNLVAFILNMQKLRELSHSKQIKIEYDGNEEAMYGFIRGAFQNYSPCVSAEIIEKNILTPFELKFVTPESEVREVIKGLVDTHKAEVKESYDLQEEIAELKRKNKQLEEEKLSAAEGKAKALVDTHKEEVKESYDLQEEIAELKRKNKQLEEENSEIPALKKKLAAAEGKAKRLEELERQRQSEEINKQLGLLEQGNTKLKEKPEVPQNKADSSESSKKSDDLLRLLGSRERLLPGGTSPLLLGANFGNTRPFPGRFFPLPVISQSSTTSSSPVSGFQLTPAPGGNDSSSNP